MIILNLYSIFISLYPEVFTRNNWRKIRQILAGLLVYNVNGECQNGISELIRGSWLKGPGKTSSPETWSKTEITDIQLYLRVPVGGDKTPVLPGVIGGKNTPPSPLHPIRHHYQSKQHDILYDPLYSCFGPI